MEWKNPLAWNSKAIPQININWDSLALIWDSAVGDYVSMG
jgi:hypothetical protein